MTAEAAPVGGPAHRPVTRLTRAQARRIALSAQGFARARPQAVTVTTRHLQRVLDTVGIVQIDSVNVVCRSQYLPFFSRLGGYDTTLLDAMRDRAPRRVVEYWAHEASLIPPSTWPLLDFRMQRAHADAWGGMQRVARDRPDVVAAVRAEVERSGPLTTRQVEAALAHDTARARDDWGWNWSVVKNALEHLFWAGEISSAGRTTQFERRYAGLARVFPANLHAAVAPGGRPPHETAYVELLRIAATAHGVGTEQCLRDYFRLKPEQARPALQTLVAEGELQPVAVEGWRRPAYLHVDARRPRRVQATALLSPFDSLVWQRDRTRALFDFDYALEIYTPAHKRVHGYYVLPFLFGDTLVARCDLKADREAGVLRVQRMSWQTGAPAAAQPALSGELEQMAHWLGLAGGVARAG